MHSRVHRLHTFDTATAIAFVKRDDELSFGISGSKLRKYASLLPHLRERGIEEAILTGTAFSNHILSLSQALIENRIKPILFLGGRKPLQPQGNFLFISLFVPSKNIHWVPPEEEETIATDFVKRRQQEGVKAIHIPIGACMVESIPGALSLVSDIERNEKELDVTFDHVFVDSGTGTTAVSLILGLKERRRSTRVHVIQMAGTKEEFEQLLQTFQEKFSVTDKSFHYTLYTPTIARSFGSTNASVWHTVRHMAREEGILVDPIYNAKLFAEGKKILQKYQLQGNVLFIHSGGGLTLTGFTEELGRVLQT